MGAAVAVMGEAFLHRGLKRTHVTYQATDVATVPSAVDFPAGVHRDPDRKHEVGG